MAVEQATVKKMVRCLGKAHGYLKQHTVETNYSMGLGHGKGEANPDPTIQNMVSTTYADDLMEGFQEGVAAYEATL